jgi:hypothetical protein
MLATDSGREVIDLGVRLEEFDEARSIGVDEVRRMFPGRHKDGLCRDAVRRWMKKARGCRPWGRQGPVLILPSVKVGRELRTMPHWVAAFQRKRLELGAQASRGGT